MGKVPLGIEQVDAYLASLEDGAIAGDMGSTYTCVLANVAKFLTPGAERANGGYHTAQASGPTIFTEFSVDSQVASYIERLVFHPLTQLRRVSKEQAMSLRPWA